MNANQANSSDMRRALQQTAVIIPARNEEQSIGLVLVDLPDVACVIVVNNGSTDDTAVIAQRRGCIVVDEPIAGYGRACLSGMNDLRQRVDAGMLDIQFVAFVDADYSDHPQELVEMMRVLCVDDADFVLGSRMHGKREPRAMPLQAVLGNWLACTLMKWIWKANYSDLGPFRAMRYDKLMSLGMQDLNFGWTIEMQIKATLNQLRIVEIPVAYRRRIGVSKISGTISGTVRAGYKILYTIAKYGWRSRNTRAQNAHSKRPPALLANQTDVARKPT